MARARTLTQFRARVRKRCFIEAETDLFPDALLDEWINESIQDFRVELSNSEVEFHLTPITGTLTAGVVSGMAHGSVPLPDDAHAVYGLQLTVDSQIVNVLPMSFADRNDYQSGTSKTGIPLGYHVTNIGTESNSATPAVNDGTIILSPAPDSAYPYTLWYLPAWEDLVDDGDMFNTIAGGDVWVIWDVCIKVAHRIDDSKNQERIATRERELAMKRTLKSLKRVNRSGPVQRRDTRSERRGAFTRSDRWP
jgi:hypothetical protein